MRTAGAQGFHALNRRQEGLGNHKQALEHKVFTQLTHDQACVESLELIQHCLRCQNIQLTQQAFPLLWGAGCHLAVPH